MIRFLISALALLGFVRRSWWIEDGRRVYGFRITERKSKKARAKKPEPPPIDPRQKQLFTLHKETPHEPSENNPQPRAELSREQENPGRAVDDGISSAAPDPVPVDGESNDPA